MLKVLSFLALTTLILSFFRKDLENRLFWLFSIFFLLLTKEYFQIFPGTPLRLICASTLEKIFNFFNITSITDSTILIFENNIQQIDYPCSGSLVLFYSLLFSFLVCLIFNSKLNFSLIAKLILVSLLSIYLNTLRIFVLILLNLKGFLFFSNKIHALFGIINYILVLGCFWFFIKNNSKKNESDNKNYLSKSILAVFFVVISFLYYVKIKTPNSNPQFEIIKHESKQNLDFSTQEIVYYRKQGAKIEKYKEGEKIVVKIASNSPLTIHNPLICLKNQDFRIIEQKTIMTDEKGFKKRLTTNKGIIYYYFIEENGKITDDYYKIAFLSLFNNKKAVLVVEYIVS